MKISEAIEKLQEILAKYGDLPIVGGYLDPESPLDKLLVLDNQGMEVFPNDPNDVAGRNPIDGVFLSL